MSARKPALVFIFITLVLDVLGIGLIVPVLPKLIEHFKALEMGLPAPVPGQVAEARVVAEAAGVTGAGSSEHPARARPVAARRAARERRAGMAPGYRWGYAVRASGLERSALRAPDLVDGPSIMLDYRDPKISVVDFSSGISDTRSIRSRRSMT